MTYSSKAIKLATVTCALLVLSVTGTANAEKQAFTEVVTFEDLDLRGDRDVERLDARLRGAVKRVCGWTPVPSIGANRELNNCREDAWTLIEPQRGLAIARVRERTSGAELTARTRGASIRIAAAK